MTKRKKTKKTFVIALDIGGTKTSIGLVNSKGRIVLKEKIFTEARKGRAVFLKNIFNIISALWKEKVTAIGIGTAGQVDPKRGVADIGPNFPKSFQNFPLKKTLARRFHVPVFVDNDANCFALAEAVFGEGKGRDFFVGVTFGTGLGVGIIINREIYRGSSNIIEPGHMTIAKDSPYGCACGKRGHLESYASGSGLKRIYKKLTGKTKNVPEITKEAKEGAKYAKEAVSEMCQGLGIGLANLISIFNPDIIVIGGGLARESFLWPKIVKATKEALPFPGQKKTKIVRSKLGEDAGILGAALITSIKT